MKNKKRKRRECNNETLHPQNNEHNKVSKKKDAFYYPAALTIAGSDNSGGAGIQADLRTFSAFGVYGCSVITAITAQNPDVVADIMPTPEKIVISQLETVLSKFSIAAVKTGMLANEQIIGIVSDVLSRHHTHIPIIVDPVIKASTGDKLFVNGKQKNINSFVDALKAKLLPLSTWITPNITEAELLTGKKIEKFDDMIEAALSIAAQFDSNCIIKGGHAVNLSPDKNMVTDIVVKEKKILSLAAPRIETINRSMTHGTGCTFSSALTASVALNMTWKDALKSAKAFVFGSLEENIQVGKKLYAMYPPSENYLRYVRLTKT